MINKKNILINNRSFKDGSLYLRLHDSSRTKTMLNGKNIFEIILSVIVEGRHMEHGPHETPNQITMLLIGYSKNESDLYEELSHGNISLHQIIHNWKCDYVSQASEDAYRYINSNLSNEEARKFFILLNDYAYNYKKNRNTKFIKKYPTESIGKTLLRQSSIRYSFEHGYKQLDDGQDVTYHMHRPSYINLVTERKESHKLHFENSANIDIPFHTLIGKNGSGKTYLLNDMIRNYLSSRAISETLFNRIITLSNTINDNCYKPSALIRNTKSIEQYHFISLTSQWHYSSSNRRGTRINLLSMIESVNYRDRRKRGMFRQVDLIDKVTNKVIPGFSFSIKTNAGNKLYSNFTQLVEEENDLVLRWRGMLPHSSEIEYVLPNEDINFYREGTEITLSSGQFSFLVSMYSLISTIETNSLIIIEEPENYLHPNLLTHFINSLTLVLRDTNSVALIATHSALVLRETPSEQVTILTRNTSITKLNKPNIETFGADTHQIMIDVFGDLNSNSIFREEVAKIAKNKNIDEAIRDYSNFSPELLSKIIVEMLN
ncbi:AAA family ATPase [Rheinheimera mangrovi]|uniref:AAA family ATPase n=1 Tax=Rheinheimera mangrovi TaxID=2498451 RepID=UPI000F8CD918|nr:AAA family ATPase [Rheinheimera mangrovi]